MSKQCLSQPLMVHSIHQFGIHAQSFLHVKVCEIFFEKVKSTPFRSLYSAALHIDQHLFLLRKRNKDVHVQILVLLFTHGIIYQSLDIATSLIQQWHIYLHVKVREKIFEEVNNTALSVSLFILCYLLSSIYCCCEQEIKKYMYRY